MVDKAHASNLAGTLEDEFALGSGLVHGLRKLGNGELGFFDPITGEVALSTLVADYVLGRSITTREGGLVFGVHGEILLKKVP